MITKQEIQPVITKKVVITDSLFASYVNAIAEVLDVDAYTGGYNLQIAFCTAQAFANHL